MSDEKITKVSIIVSKGSLEGVYPGLIMANGARAEGMRSFDDEGDIRCSRRAREQQVQHPVRARREQRRPTGGIRRVRSRRVFEQVRGAIAVDIGLRAGG